MAGFCGIIFFVLYHSFWNEEECDVFCSVVAILHFCVVLDMPMSFCV